MQKIGSAKAINDKMVFAIAVAISVFHLLNVSGVLALSTMPIRIIHLLAMILIVFLTKGSKKGFFRKIDVLVRSILALTTIFCSIYLLTRWESIASSGGVTTNLDIIVGTIMIIVVLEATRRSVGLVLACISTLFFIYPFIGPFLPGLLGTRSYSLSRIITVLFTTSDGIYGIPISVSANYIIVFCIYGAFLSEFGAGTFLFEVSSNLTKRFSAASAKTSIIFSALIGMISGSAAGNVAITGSLTIPMMEKENYTKEQAGAISAVAATGGQIMPPIMGAAAFIMASIIGTPYANVMKAAIVPSILYFLSIFLIVHLVAKKSHIKSYVASKDKTFKETFKEGWPLSLPLIVLIGMMVLGYSPFKAAFISILSLLLVYIPHEFFKNKTFDANAFIRKIIVSLKKGALDTVSIATACAAAGIISGILSVSGLSSKLALVIIGASQGKLLIALLLTMLVSLVLGMGLPTTAAYLVLASVVAPALVQIGATPMSAHLFVFYFGCISTITPPVALASYVAAGIAKADLNKVGFTAFLYGLVGFILPFMFVFNENLLLNGPLGQILVSVFFAVSGIVALGMAIVGYVVSDINPWQRGVLVISSFLLIFKGALTDSIGMGLLVAIVLISYISKNREKSKNEAV